MTATKEMTAMGFGHDPHDAEWESSDTGRTVYRPGSDDDYCEVCDGPVVRTAAGYRCKCDDAVSADVENGPSAADAPVLALHDLPVFAWKGDAADWERP